MTYKIYGYIKTKLNYPTVEGNAYAYTEKLNKDLTEELEYTLDNYEHYRVSCVPIIQRVKVPRGKAEKIGRPLDIELSDNILDRDFDFSLLVGHVFNFVIDDVYNNPPKNVGELIFEHIQGHVESFDVLGVEGEVSFFSIVEWGCTIETLNGVYVYKNGKPLTVSVPEPKQEVEFPSYTKFTTERPSYGEVVNLIVVAPNGAMTEYNDYYYFKDRLFIPLDDGENVRVGDDLSIFWQKAETDDQAEDGMDDLVDEIRGVD